MKKRGQFYLLASAIIAVILVGLISITNYSSKKDLSRVDEFGKNLEIESEKVLDYDSLNSENKIENFSREYSKYIGNVSAYFIIVDGSEEEAYKFNGETKVDLTTNLTVADNEIIFDAGDTEYSFDLNKGKNFYFILSQKIGDENYVYTN